MLDSCSLVPLLIVYKIYAFKCKCYYISEMVSSSLIIVRDAFQRRWTTKFLLNQKGAVKAQHRAENPTHNCKLDNYFNLLHSEFLQDSLAYFSFLLTRHMPVRCSLISLSPWIYSYLFLSKKPCIIWPLPAFLFSVPYSHPFTYSSQSYIIFLSSPPFSCMCSIMLFSMHRIVFCPNLSVIFTQIHPKANILKKSLVLSFSYLLSLE